MNQTLRSLAAGATGGVVMAAIVLGQPALADQLDKVAAKNSVTSKSIKNGTIKGKDLNADLNASLAKANSAVQNVNGFAAAQTGSQDITANTSFTTVISKALPAGNYLVNAKAILSVDNTDNNQSSSQQCRLTNGTATDVAQTAGPTGTVFLFHRNVGTVNMALPITGPATVTLQCKNDLNAPPAGYQVSVSAGRITAIQTTTNN